jgi:hypothetical protein
MIMTTSSMNVDATAAATAPTDPPKHPAFRYQFYPRLLRSAQYLVVTIPIINYLTLRWFHGKEYLNELKHFTGDYREAPREESFNAWWYWLDAD